MCVAGPKFQPMHLDSQHPDMLLDSYDYHLPQELIAQRPVEPRDHSRLLIYNAKLDEMIHTKFVDLPKYLEANDALVVNNSKVFPCRLIGEKPSGGKAEIFVLDLNAVDGLYPCLCKASGKRKIGEEFIFAGLCAKLEKIEGQKFYFSFNQKNLHEFLDQQGLVPIPPYIRKGESDHQDKLDYQTIYAKDSGSVAAPTAGLHFTDRVFAELSAKGIQKAEVTLHVGMGTFAPVKVDNILEHQMHEEFYYIEDPELIAQNYGNLIAVGTTSLRTLESCANENGGFEYSGGPQSTDIFLYPGKPVHSIKGLITNFHLPKSTLLMLVSSIIGREKTLELYDIAVKEKYRFFSYGDAMLILR